ncbi:MAG: diacylglycerol kinase family protein [Cyclobacteriaceae bacterium]
MKDSEPFKLKNRVLSFKYALDGLQRLISEEHNARIHAIVAIMVIGCSIWFNISPLEWCLVLLSVGIVFISEAFNSSIERLADLYSRDKNPQIKVVKDLAAGAVLLAALIALIIGLIIFIPKILALGRTF